MARTRKTYILENEADNLRLLADKGVNPTSLEQCHGLHKLLEPILVQEVAGPNAKARELRRVLTHVVKTSDALPVQLGGDLIGILDPEASTKGARIEAAVERGGVTERTIRKYEKDYLKALLYAIEDYLEYPKAASNANAPPPERTQASPAHGGTASKPTQESMAVEGVRPSRCAKKPTRRQVFFELLFFITISSPLILLMLPVSHWPPVKFYQELASGPRALIIIALWALGTLFLTRRLPRRFPIFPARRLSSRWCFVALVVLTSILASFTQQPRRDNHDTTAFAEFVSDMTKAGNRVLNYNFDEEGPCPSEGSSTNYQQIAFTSCKLDGGALHAVLTTGTRALGAFPAEVNQFWTEMPPGQSHDYYIETSFRSVDEAQLSSCGLWIEGEFIHPRRLPPPHRGFIPVASTTESQAKDHGDIKNEQFARTADRSSFAWEEGKWTRLTVAILDNRIIVFVNDRKRLIFSHPALDPVKRLGVAIQAGTDYAGGDGSLRI